MPRSPYRYHLYYAGCADESEMIGVAMSNDLKRWWRPETNPIIPRGPAGAYDAAQTSNPTIVETADGLTMIYQAKDDDGVFRFGLARSEDGVVWRKAAEPVVSTIPRGGLKDAPYREGIQHPHLVRLENLWRLYFVESRSGRHRIRVAESDSLDEFAISDTICLEQELACESFSIYYPWIAKLPDGWVMWYSAVELRGDKRVWNIVRAVSPDGLQWRRDPAGPIVTGSLPHTRNRVGRLLQRSLQRAPRGLIDDVSTRVSLPTRPINLANPSVAITDGGRKLTMYYHAALIDGGVGIGRMHSTDGIHWNQREEMVLGHRPDGWERDFNADPFLLELQRSDVALQSTTPEFEAVKRMIDQVPIERGTSLWVHSALRRLGGRNAQPEKIIDYLLERIGPSGTLLMPMFPMPGSTADYIKANDPFDPRKTKPSMGVLPNILFEQYPIERSLYPWVSIGALGPRAKDFTSTHHLDPWPMGKQSPFYRLYENGGKILLLGVGWERNSNLHIIESLRGDAYPARVFEPGVAPMKYVAPDGTVHPVDVKVPSMRMKTTDWNGWGAALNELYKFEHHFKHDGMYCSYIDARGMLDAITRGLDHGIYPYTSRFTLELRKTWPLIRLGRVGRKAAAKLVRSTLRTG